MSTRPAGLTWAIALGLALPLLAAGGAGAAKKAPLTETEKELRGWLWNRSAKTRVRLAVKPDLVSTVAINTRQGTITLITLHTDVDRFGQVTYQGRTLFGMKAKLTERDIRHAARPGTEFEIVGFTLKDDRIAVAARRKGGREHASLRLWLGAGFQSRMDAGAMLAELGRALDFGPDLDRLLRVRGERQGVEQRLAEREAVFRDEGRELDARITAGRELERTLQEALRVQSEYDRLTNTESPRKQALRQTQIEVGGELAKLEKVRLVARRARIAAAMQAVEARLVAADARFRDPSGGSRERLETAAGIVEALEGIGRECDEYQKLGGEELAAEAGIRRALASFSGWLARSEAALTEGCLRSEGLRLAEIEKLLAVPAPDAAVAREIGRCGVEFEPDAQTVERLLAAGMGERAKAALVAGEPSRLARADLPRLEEIIVEAAAALDQAPVVAERVAARPAADAGSSYDASTGLHWSEPAGGQLDHNDAERYCRELPAAGGGSWRLPKLDELERVSRSLRQRFGSRVLWSGTTRSARSAWAYDVAAGSKQKARRKFSLRHVACVRGA